MKTVGSLAACAVRLCLSFSLCLSPSLLFAEPHHLPNRFTQNQTGAVYLFICSFIHFAPAKGKRANSPTTSTIAAVQMQSVSK